MSAQILREAASLMRERAEAAIAGDAHGPWRAHNYSVVRDESVGPAMVMIAREGVAGYLSPTYRDTATHIASWHPAVALAVADWLDTTEQILSGWATAAATCHEIEERGEECGCSMKDCYECGQWHKCSHSRPNVSDALAVARAYLGTP